MFEGSAFNGRVDYEMQKGKVRINTVSHQKSTASELYLNKLMESHINIIFLHEILQQSHLFQLNNAEYTLLRYWISNTKLTMLSSEAFPSDSK